MDEILEQRHPVCLVCKHFNGDWSCSAFPEIPIEILRGENDHTKPLPEQDNYIVFKYIDEEV